MKAYDGWREEAMADRRRREKNTAAMNAFVVLFEECEAGTGDHDLLCLALHHVAMAHGSYALKKTLKCGLRSSIEKLSQVAPAIFPPNRVPKRRSR